MKRLIIAAVALALTPFAAFADDKPTEAQMARIDEVLKAKTCEVDPENVEVNEGVFELDDVMCASGQYDMKLGADFTVSEERKE